MDEEAPQNQNEGVDQALALNDLGVVSPMEVQPQIIPPFGAYYPPPPICNTISADILQQYKEEILSMNQECAPFKEPRPIKLEKHPLPQEVEITRKSLLTLKRYASDVIDEIVAGAKLFSRQVSQSEVEHHNQQLAKVVQQYNAFESGLRVSQARMAVCEMLLTETLELEEKTREINRTIDDIYKKNWERSEVLLERAVKPESDQSDFPFN